VLEVLNYPAAKDVWNMIGRPRKNIRTVETFQAKQGCGRPRRISNITSVADPSLNGTESALSVPKVIFLEPLLPEIPEVESTSGAASKGKLNANVRIKKNVAVKPQTANEENESNCQRRSKRKLGMKMAKKMVKSAKNRRANDNSDSPFVITSSGKYSCVKCPKVFTVKCNLIQHLDKHNGKSTCPHCKCKCSSQRNMLVHMYIKHYSDPIKTSKLPWSGKWCEICKTDVSYLKQHVITWHLDWLTCPVCKEKFPKKLKMLLHLLNTHATTKK